MCDSKGLEDNISLEWKMKKLVSTNECMFSKVLRLAASTRMNEPQIE